MGVFGEKRGRFNDITTAFIYEIPQNDKKNYIKIKMIKKENNEEC